MSSSRLSRVAAGSVRTVLRHGRVPAGVSWIITNRCNLRCVYCDCPLVKVPELNTEQALDVIDEMAAMGTARVHLTGGEPLTRKDLGTLITRMRFFAMEVSVSSNGTLVPKKRRLLRDCRSVSLSLDGPPAVHDHNRADGQVDEVIAALKTLRELEVDRYLTCLVTSRTDERCLRFVLDVAAEHGAEVFFQPALDVVLATDRVNPVAAGPEHVREMLARVLELERAGAPVGNSRAGLTDLMTWPRQRRLRCPVNRLAVRITPEGVLLPCHERAAVPDGESVLDGGFAAAFSRLQLKRCTECWGAGRVEMRLSVARGPLGLPEFLSS